MGRPVGSGLKQYCVRGHDTFVVGRFRVSGACKACDKINAAAYRKRQGRKPLTSLSRITLPIEPLLPYVVETNRLTKQQRNAVNRAKTRTGRVTLSLADEICVALAMHPAEVFGQAWFEDSA